jgi:serine/threonine protein kinase
MANVYRGQESDTHREVAVKVLSPALATDPNYVKSFRSEIAQLHRLNHRNCGAGTACFRWQRKRRLSLAFPAAGQQPSRALDCLYA